MSETSYSATKSEIRDFVDEVSELHEKKSAGYGNSWRRRGEILGILANEARKVDRLEFRSDNDTESMEDTATDLLVYLVKHRIWLVAKVSGITVPGHEFIGGVGTSVDDSDDPTLVKSVLQSYGKAAFGRNLVSVDVLIDWITKRFNDLEESVMESSRDRHLIVNTLIGWSFDLALRLWKKRKWKESNEARRFDGYATTEEADW